MERRKKGTIFIAIMTLGAIISTIGMMVASGVYPGEILFNLFETTSIFFVLFGVIGLALFFEDEEDQSDNESDSSLL